MQDDDELDFGEDDLFIPAAQPQQGAYDDEDDEDAVSIPGSPAFTSRKLDTPQAAVVVPATSDVDRSHSDNKLDHRDRDSHHHQHSTSSRDAAYDPRDQRPSSSSQSSSQYARPNSPRASSTAHVPTPTPAPAPVAADPPAPPAPAPRKYHDPKTDEHDKLLPPGWTSRVSSQGDIYYKQDGSGNSVWEIPPWPEALDERKSKSPERKPEPEPERERAPEPVAAPAPRRLAVHPDRLKLVGITSEPTSHSNAGTSVTNAKGGKDADSRNVDARNTYGIRGAAAQAPPPTGPRSPEQSRKPLPPQERIIPMEVDRGPRSRGGGRPPRRESDHGRGAISSVNLVAVAPRSVSLSSTNAVPTGPRVADAPTGPRIPAAPTGPRGQPAAPPAAPAAEAPKWAPNPSAPAEAGPKWASPALAGPRHLLGLGSAMSSANRVAVGTPRARSRSPSPGAPGPRWAAAGPPSRGRPDPSRRDSRARSPPPGLGPRVDRRGRPDLDAKALDDSLETYTASRPPGSPDFADERRELPSLQDEPPPPPPPSRAPAPAPVPLATSNLRGSDESRGAAANSCAGRERDRDLPPHRQAGHHPVAPPSFGNPNAPVQSIARRRPSVSPPLAPSPIEKQRAREQADRLGLPRPKTAAEYIQLGRHPHSDRYSDRYSDRNSTSNGNSARGRSPTPQRSGPVEPSSSTAIKNSSADPPPAPTPVPAPATVRPPAAVNNWGERAKRVSAQPDPIPAPSSTRRHSPSPVRNSRPPGSPPPRRRSQSPRRRSQSPRRRSQSPRRRSQSPRRRSRSPPPRRRRLSRSPPPRGTPGGGGRAGPIDSYRPTMTAEQAHHRALSPIFADRGFRGRFRDPDEGKAPSVPAVEEWGGSAGRGGGRERSRSRDREREKERESSPLPPVARGRERSPPHAARGRERSPVGGVGGSFTSRIAPAAAPVPAFPLPANPTKVASPPMRTPAPLPPLPSTSTASWPSRARSRSRSPRRPALATTGSSSEIREAPPHQRQSLPTPSTAGSGSLASRLSILPEKPSSSSSSSLSLPGPPSSSDPHPNRGRSSDVDLGSKRSRDGRDPADDSGRSGGGGGGTDYPFPPNDFEFDQAGPPKRRRGGGGGGRRRGGRR